MGWMTNRLPTMWSGLISRCLPAGSRRGVAQRWTSGEHRNQACPAATQTCDFTALSFGPLVLIASGGVQVTGTACAWREAGGG